MSHDDHDEGKAPPLGHIAAFSDRVVAFSADVALFSAGYFLSLALLFPAVSVWINPHSNIWKAVWIAFFLIYSAYCSCEGRRTIGKALLGLRVVDFHGEPLSLQSAIMRSATYLVSSIFDLGFLWALFNRSGQCWHDMVVGSVVIADAPKSRGMRLLVRAGALACISFAAGQWYWNEVAAPRYHRIMDVAYANVGLREIATLERIYYVNNGQYAHSVISLAPLSGQPEKFLADVDNVFDRNAGVQIDTTDKGFTIHAKAIDDNHTLVAMNGP